MPKVGDDFVPSYRKHKSTGQAIVTLNGRDYYLGKHGTKASRAAYDELIARWLASGRRLPADESQGLTLSELILRYVHFATKHYSPDGETPEIRRIRDVCRILRQLFGRTPAGEFGPKKLKICREAMLHKGWCRSNVNHQILRIKRLVKWGVSEEILPPSAYHAIQSVTGLRKGAPGTREAPLIRPVTEKILEATIPLLPPPLAAIARLQLLSGMRPSEALKMRRSEIDMSGTIWLYKPAAHKNAHLEHTRTVYLGPKAQQVLSPWLQDDSQVFVFSPLAAEELRNAERRHHRKTPMTPSQRRRKRKRNRRRPWGPHYDVPSYRRAILRSCDKAYPLPQELGQQPGESVLKWRSRLTDEQKAAIRDWRRQHHWHPNQLRHTAATRLRKEFGVELTRIVLGHATAFTTEIYAEADQAQAMEVIEKVG